MKNKLWGVVYIFILWTCLSTKTFAYHVEDVPYEYKEAVVFEGELYTYEDLQEDCRLLARKHKVEVECLGSTACGREIYYLSYGEGDLDILVSAGIHGREYYNPYLVMKQFEEFLVEDEDEELYSQVTIHLVPMINPDGIAISQFGEEAVPEEMRQLLRDCYEYDSSMGYTSSSYERYLRRWKANGLGVDLNRNFEVGFGGYGSKSSVSGSGYKGEAPMDQVETKAVSDLIQEIVPEVSVSYHSYGEVIYYGYSGHYNTASKKLSKNVARETGYSRNETHANGGMLEYTLSINPECACVTLETGAVQCPFSYKYGPKIYRKNQDVLDTAVDFAIENVTAIESFGVEELNVDAEGNQVTGESEKMGEQGR